VAAVDSSNIADAAAAALDPNHSHFVLVQGDDANWKCNLAKAFAASTPTLAIVVGGESSAKNEVLYAVRQNIPVIVIEGSTGLASEIAVGFSNKPAVPDDPGLAEIVAEGAIHLHSLTNSAKGLERLIRRELGGDNVLMMAWERFADYDSNAVAYQTRFNNLQVTILAIGVLGTALAISKEHYGITTGVLGYWYQKLLIAIPIVLTLLITVANRFKQGNKWLLLRASAEAMKREIYRYRTRSGPYTGVAGQPSPEQQLSEKIEDITQRAMRTEVNTSAIVPYDKSKGFPPYMYAAQGGDDGFSPLTPDRYIEVRLGDQLNYFQRTARKLDRQLRVMQWLIFIIGGVATYLSAVNQQVWIALTTSLVATLTTYLSYRQTENTLMKYNQASSDLTNVRAWWIALSAEEQARQENIDALVNHTEKVLESELDGWIQQMQNALAELRKDQAPPTDTTKQEKPSAEAKPKPESKSPAAPVPVAPVTSPAPVAPQAALQPAISSEPASTEKAQTSKEEAAKAQKSGQ
jgi:hypothetical protein